MKLIKRPKEFEAVQWFKPEDFPDTRFYNACDLRPNGTCRICDKPNKGHGYFDYGEFSFYLCPGDWIVTNPQGRVRKYTTDQLIRKFAIPNPSVIIK